MLKVVSNTKYTDKKLALTGKFFIILQAFARPLDLQSEERGKAGGLGGIGGRGHPGRKEVAAISLRHLDSEFSTGSLPPSALVRARLVRSRARHAGMRFVAVFFEIGVGLHEILVKTLFERP